MRGKVEGGQGVRSCILHLVQRKGRGQEGTGRDGVKSGFLHAMPDEDAQREIGDVPRGRRGGQVSKTRGPGLTLHTWARGSMSRGGKAFWRSANCRTAAAGVCRRAAAVSDYWRFVAAGIGAASPWQGLKSQIYLGSDQFVERMQGWIARCGRCRNAKERGQGSHAKERGQGSHVTSATSPSTLASSALPSANSQLACQPDAELRPAVRARQSEAKGQVLHSSTYTTAVVRYADSGTPGEDPAPGGGPFGLEHVQQ